MAPEPKDDIMNEKNPRPLDKDGIALLKTYFLHGGETAWGPGGPRLPRALPITCGCGAERRRGAGRAPPSPPPTSTAGDDERGGANGVVKI
uniref:Uncharacterized protein n=1 Tax=Leersia perrieri TaxID=77586 RepID=A0A0D9WMU4_9ORYZ